jgi:hypothetical protein
MPALRLGIGYSLLGERIPKEVPAAAAFWRSEDRIPI